MKVLISMSASSESPALSMALKKHLIKLKDVLPSKLGKASIVLKQELPRKYTLKITSGKAKLFLNLIFTASSSTVKDAKITGTLTFGKEEVRLATFAKKQGISIDLNASTLVKLVKELTKVYGESTVKPNLKVDNTVIALFDKVTKEVRKTLDLEGADDVWGLCEAVSYQVLKQAGYPAGWVLCAVKVSGENHALLCNEKTKEYYDPTADQFDFHEVHRDLPIGIASFASRPFFKQRKIMTPSEIQDAADILQEHLTENGIVLPKLNPNPVVSLPAMLIKALEKATALGVESKTLESKLSKIPYILSVKRAKKQTGLYDDTKQAGFFPPNFLSPDSTITFVNGSKMKGAEVFAVMKKVGGGLTGTPSKVHNMQKGLAPSRLTGEMLRGSTGDVTIDGFEVPGAWVAHYKTKHKIPLNLYTNNIEGLSVCYIAKKPVV